MKLLWVIDKLKQLYWVGIGLILCNLPDALHNIVYVRNISEGNAFWKSRIFTFPKGVFLVHTLDMTNVMLKSNTCNFAEGSRNDKMIQRITKKRQYDVSERR